MNGWKKIGISIIIIVILFGSGFSLGYWRSNQIGDSDYQLRIDELKQLNTELDSGYTKLESDYRRSETRLKEFLSAEADRNRRATEILGQAGEKASEASGSIGRAIAGLARLSEAIEILLGNN